MKKLVAIATAVGAAIAIVVFLNRSPEPTAPASSNSEQPQSPADPVATGTSAGTQRASTASEGSRPVAASPTDAQKLAACHAMWTRRSQRNEAKLAAEPKDPAWAYAMEQKLREFTSRRFQSSEMNVIAIDCRTQYCDIRAQGFEPEKTAKEFAEGMGEVQSQPWNDFSGTSVWHEQEPDKTVHIARLSRPQAKTPESEDPLGSPAERTCWELQAREQEREQALLRAARDAQARDAGWAEPMEYQLRQYMTAQLAKHPVDHLDIDCRTTFCRMEASGRTNESQSAFQKAAEEAANEPWANLWHAEMSSRSESGNWDGSVILRRREKPL